MSEPIHPKNEPTDTEQLRTHDGWPCYREHSLFEAAVEEASRELEVSREMAIICALGAMAAACQGHVDVEMPPGNRSPTSLMLLIIAESGERKTSTQKYFFKSINNKNSAALSAHEIALREHRVQHKMWSTEQRHLERMYGKYASLGEVESADAAMKEIEEHLRTEPYPSSSGKFLYEDTTPQALVQFLYENSPNGCLLTSEANSIFNGKILNELDKLNTLWDGGSVMVDRLSRDPITLDNARLTFSLMAQPSVISNFMGRRGDEARGTGFLARFLIARPRSKAGSRVFNQRSSQPRHAAFNDRISELLESPPPEAKQVLRFSEPAKRRWIFLNEFIENEMNDKRKYRYLKDHASKLLENTSRIAAVIHAFERESSDDVEIDLFTLNFSWALAQACSEHFVKYLANEPQIVTDACELANYLLRISWDDPRNSTILDEGDPGANMQRSRSKIPNHLREGFKTQVTLTQIKQRGPYRLRGRANAERLAAAIELLKDLGHIVKDGGHYNFKESILTEDEPRTKNGEFITISALPLYRDQEYLLEDRVSGRLRSGRYYIKNLK
ncbi:YfjI family protein [Pseudomonas sp. NY15435]|uniref:YfjI family protein n=1 Tax=Pseudomonas sp. NY15435 TaxID=3400358 RepID=UPI003A83A7C4